MEFIKMIELLINKGIETRISTFNYEKVGYPNAVLSIHMRKNDFNIKRMIDINELHCINLIIEDMVKELELYAR